MSSTCSTPHRTNSKKDDCRCSDKTRLKPAPHSSNVPERNCVSLLHQRLVNTVQITPLTGRA